MRSVLYRLCGAAQLDDLTQEVFVKVWKALPKFEGKSQLSTWVYRISVNTAIEHLRKKTLQKGSIEVSQLESPKSLSKELETRQLAEHSLSSLELNLRTVATLHYLEDLSVAEIASILEKPEGTIKFQLSEARKQMRTFLSQQGIQV